MMRLIFSRKGVDAGSGRLASPLFPDGTLRMLPIPERAVCRNAPTYADLGLGRLVAELSRGRLSPDTPAHLDPDLDATLLPRTADWRPIFGQSGAAERHLQRQGVGTGDVFLFFGWFRPVERHNETWRYVANDHGGHYIFGWLQIDRRIASHEWQQHAPWAADHPHCRRIISEHCDSLYLAAEHLRLPNVATKFAGAGMVRHIQPAVRLSALGAGRSVWRVPMWMHPHGKRSRLSYHGDLRRWRKTDDHVLLQTVGRGQEFVLDCADYPEAAAWLAGLIAEADCG